MLSSVLERSLSAHLMPIQLLSVTTFYLNGRLHAVSNGKLNGFLKNEPNFGFLHIPIKYITGNVCLFTKQLRCNQFTSQTTNNHTATEANMTDGSSALDNQLLSTQRSLLVKILHFNF